MKKLLLFLLTALLLIVFLGCSSQKDSVQTGNPWKEYDTLKDAEKAVGFHLGTSENIAEEFHAEEFRVMNNELLEIVYRSGEYEVTIRKSSGENQDNSGVFLEFEDVSKDSSHGFEITHKHIDGCFLTLFSFDGYSYSLYAPNGYPGDMGENFILAVIH